MPRYLELKAHRSVEELKAAWKGCDDPVEKTHWHLLWRYSQGASERSLPEVAQECGLDPSWARRLIHRYNARGAEGLRDRRADNGAQPLLDEAQLEVLRQAVGKDPEDGGLWSGPKVAHWMARRLGRAVVPQVGWQYLNKLGMSWKVPRPKHAQSATDQEKAAYKKTRRGSGRTGPKPSGQKGRAVGRR